MTFTPAAGTIQLTSLNPTITQGATNNFFNLTLNNGATLGSALTVGGVLTVSSGVLNTNGRNLSVTGTTGVSTGATITGSAGTMGFTGAVTVTGTGAINGAAGAITFASSVSGTGTLRESSTTTSVAGDLIMNTFTANGGTVVVNGAGAQTVNGYTFNNLQINDGGGTVTSGGAWTVGGALTLTAGTWDAATFIHQIAGNWNSSAITFTASASTIRMTGANPSITLGAQSFNNLTLNNGATLASAITVGGTLTMSAGVVSPGGFTHLIAGNWNDASVTFTPAAGTIQLTSLNPTITQGATNNFFNLTLDNGATQLSTVNVDGALTVSAGTMSAGANNLNVTGVTTIAGTINGGSGTTTFTGNVGGTGTLIASSGTTNVGGDLTVTNFNANGGTVVVNGAGAQTVNGYTFNNLQINNGGGTVTSGGAWTVGGALALTAGTWDAATFIHQIAGNWNSSAITFTANASTIRMTGGNPSITLGAQAFNNLTLDNGATLGSALTVGGVLTVSSGVLNTNGRNLSVTGTTGVSTGATITGSAGTMGFTGAVTVTGTGAINGAAGAITFASSVSGTGTLRESSTTTSVAGDLIMNTFTANGGTVVVNGAGAQTVNGYTFNNLQINDGGGTVTSGGAWTVGGALTLTAGTWDAATFIHQIAGNWNSSAITFTANASTIRMTGGNPSITLGAQGFNNLTLNNGATLGSALTVGGVLTVSSGVLNTNGRNLSVTGTTGVSTGATITGSAGTMGFTGAVTVTGTGAINGAAGAITFASSVSGTGTLRESSTTTSVAGDLIMNTFTANGGTVVVNGAGAQTVNGYTFNNLQINDGGGTVTSGGAWTVGGALTLTSGTWAPAGFTHLIAGNWDDTAVTFTPAAGTIQLTSLNPTITQGATNNFFNLTLNNGATLGSALTVGGVLTVSSGVLNTNGRNLSVTGTTGVSTGATITGSAGTMGFTGAVTVTGTGAINGAAGAITFASSVSGTGTLRESSTTTSVAGNLIMNTFTANGGTVVLNGTAAQTTRGYAFNNLTVNNTSGLNPAVAILVANLTVAGTFIHSAGTINLNGRGLTVSGGATLGAIIQNSGVAAGFSVTGAVTLSAPVSITTNGGAITFSSTINGPQTLLLTAGAGPITVGNTIGTAAGSPNNLLTFTVASASATSLRSVFTSGAQAVSGGTITLNGTYQSTAAGGTIGFSTPVTLGGAVAVTTSNSTISFSSTISGAQTLTIACGTAIATVSGTVTISTLAITNGTVDVQGNDFTLGTLTNTGTFALNGTQPTQSITTMTMVAGVVQYYDGGADGNILLDRFYTLEIPATVAATRRFTLGQDIVVGPVAGGGEVRIANGILDVDAAPNSRTITLYGNWTNTTADSSHFVPQEGTVEFARPSGDITILGNNKWYIFWCTIPGVVIKFESQKIQEMVSYGSPRFHVQGSAWGAKYANEIWLEATLAYTIAPPPSPPPAGNTHWIFDVDVNLLLELNFVWIDNSWAWPTSITTPPVTDVQLVPLAADHCRGWERTLEVNRSYTEDSDGNGRIDAIVVTLPSPHNGLFGGFTVHVAGYSLAAVPFTVRAGPGLPHPPAGGSDPRHGREPLLVDRLQHHAERHPSGRLLQGRAERPGRWRALLRQGSARVRLHPRRGR